MVNGGGECRHGDSLHQEGAAMPVRTAVKAAIAVLAGWVALSALAGCAVDIW